MTSMSQMLMLLGITKGEHYTCIKLLSHFCLPLQF